MVQQIYKTEKDKQWFTETLHRKLTTEQHELQYNKTGGEVRCTGMINNYCSVV